MKINTYFITGNKNKFKEAKEILPEIKQIKLYLPEIQEMDAKKIIEEKLKEAIKKNKGNFFCEDTSLYINSLNGLPGPLIKWFMQTLGNKGIFKLIENSNDKSATAKTIIGYTDGKKVLFFEGAIKGKIVFPRGKTNFGWDPLFMPKGYNKTFAGLGLNEKNKISMRRKALIKLKSYLEK